MSIRHNFLKHIFPLNENKVRSFQLTVGDCEKALKKDKYYMGSQSVSIKAVSKQTMQEAIQKQFTSDFTTVQNGTNSSARDKIVQNIIPVGRVTPQGSASRAPKGDDSRVVPQANVRGAPQRSEQRKEQPRPAKRTEEPEKSMYWEVSESLLSHSEHLS